MTPEHKSSKEEKKSDVQAAAALVLEREELRKKQVAARAKRRRRERRREERESIQRMHQSIEVIKWCIVGICTVWVVSFFISIIVLVKVQGKVTEIEGQVDAIRQVVDNPFANAGARFGGQLDERLRDYFGLPATPDDGK